MRTFGAVESSKDVSDGSSGKDVAIEQCPCKSKGGFDGLTVSRVGLVGSHEAVKGKSNNGKVMDMVAKICREECKAHEPLMPQWYYQYHIWVGYPDFGNFTEWDHVIPPLVPQQQNS
ncbi:hypothetical protein CCACVL1_28172 [Corchorus capsularis]|uniref:Uncharacterized protein n=1 Tax=Corchorus capsularis TaxID=210143 RepID=A0A1R3G7D1_COCAP|nr:hypothetical protein CCACVL1_28172 [Corchorus capsularis]